MNLDDYRTFSDLDPQAMYDHIQNLPEQLQAAWDLGASLPALIWNAEAEQTSIQQVVIAGMGGSAIGGDLVSAYLEPWLQVPIVVHRDYGLPAWAAGPQTLVIASSHSGNTEETLDSFQAALQRDCRCLTISTGGTLAQEAGSAGVTAWIFQHQGQPRAAVGFSFGLLLSAFKRLGLLPDPGLVERELKEAVSSMRTQQESLKSELPAVKNPAKRLAGQLVGRWVAVFGTGLLNPVARRWKGQVSEIGKAWAQFEFLPEADHNTLAGTINPQTLFPQMIALFLHSPSDHPRNRLRLDLTRKGFMLEGIGTDFHDAQGSGRMAHQWTTLHFGDYMAYYLAMAYGVDPTPVTALQELKAQLAAAG